LPRAAIIGSRNEFESPYRCPESGRLGEVDARGVNVHDVDLVPIDATLSERNAINQFGATMAWHACPKPIQAASLWSRCVGTSFFSQEAGSLRQKPVSFALKSSLAVEMHAVRHSIR